jgi:hypothetical protein
MNRFNDDTCFLFAEPSFWSGFATVLDAGGTLAIYNESRTPQEADARALASDWAVIGKEIRRAVKVLEKEKEAQVA